jgi:hypothetical protein
MTVFATNPKIDAVAGADINSKFLDASAQGFAVAGQPYFQARDPTNDRNLRLPVA